MRKSLLNPYNFFLCLSLTLNIHQHYHNVKINDILLKGSLLNTSELTPIKKKHIMSNKKGFNPIFIYSNRATAISEIPKFSNSREYKGEIGLGITASAYAQVKQDSIVLALTEANWELEKQALSDSKKKKFFFLDLAANHAILLSNTLYLEQNGWDGICIEGNPEYWYELGRYRTCTIVGAFVGGMEENDGQQVDIALRSSFGGIVNKDFDNKKSEETVKRDLVSIKTILNDAECPEIIDYFSLDVEGAESFVMKDFPWEMYTFRFLTIERPKDDLVELLNFHGYSKYKKNLSKWGETLWIHKSVKLSENKIEEIVMSF